MADYPFTVLILVSTIAVSWLSWQRYGWIDRLIFDTDAVLRRGEGYRIITSGWIHADMAHLLFNMFSLWSFGSALEPVYGPQAVLAPHLAGIVGGKIISIDVIDIAVPIIIDAIAGDLIRILPHV